ncbi:hypothetical protein JCM8547_001666 [Rhodosporidiobolus lusitaniae]
MLKLTRASEQRCGALTSFPSVGQRDSLRVAAFKCVLPTPEMFATCGSLRDVRFCELQEVYLRWFEGLPSLFRLVLSKCTITAVPSSLPPLVETTSTSTSCFPSYLEVGFFAPSTLPSLTSLCVTNGSHIRSALSAQLDSITVAPANLSMDRSAVNRLMQHDNAPPILLHVEARTVQHGAVTDLCSDLPHVLIVDKLGEYTDYAFSILWGFVRLAMQARKTSSLFHVGVKRFYLPTRYKPTRRSRTN